MKVTTTIKAGLSMDTEGPTPTPPIVDVQ